jgi:polyisoprenoid-binding protein YceI
MNATRRFATSLALALGALTLAPAAEAKLTHSGSAQVRFLATGPAGLKIEGKDDKLAVAEEGEGFKITVPLAGLQTGISLRDKHMRDKYLEVGKFPNAELVVAKAEVKLPTGGESKGQAKGTFTLHGVSKPVVVEYTISGKDGAYKITGTFRTNFNDHGIEVPSYLGVTVKPDVEVTVGFETADQP